MASILLDCISVTMIICEQFYAIELRRSEANGIGSFEQVSFQYNAHNYTLQIALAAACSFNVTVNHYRVAVFYCLEIKMTPRSESLGVFPKSLDAKNKQIKSHDCNEKCVTYAS